MNIFEELHTKVNSVIENLDEMIVEAMVEGKDQIIDLNVSQLEEGINKHGETISPEYASDEYAKFKQSIGSKAPFGVPDLKLEGDFHSAFYAEPYLSGNEGMSGLFVGSKDPKSSKLEDQYSGLFGIAPQNTPILEDIIIEPLQKKILNAIIN